jgi:hypothetical protein
MPEASTDEILQQVEEIRERAAREDAEFRAEFLPALNRLRAAEGLPPIPALGEEAFHALIRLPNVVVSREPVASGSRLRPSFLVARNARSVLIEIVDSSWTRWWSRRRRAELTRMLPAYGACAGFVVVSDGSRTPGADESSVAVVELSELVAAVDQALGGSQ